MKIYKKLENSNKYMEISLLYRKGGANFFSGQVEARGYEIEFTLVEKGDNMISYAPMNNTNFRLLLKEVLRYSDKAYDLLEEKIKNNQEKLFSLYESFINNQEKLTFDKLKKVALA